MYQSRERMAIDRSYDRSGRDDGQPRVDIM
jgi:hypothetical protein